MEHKHYAIPSPILDSKERNFLVKAAKQYKKMTGFTRTDKLGAKMATMLPKDVQKTVALARDAITNQKFYIQAMDIAAKGFEAIEKQAVKFTVSESTILKEVDGVVLNNNIVVLDEICLARSYDIEQLVEKFKQKNIALALVEGAVTSFGGLMGISFNLALSTFIYYRSVQSVAMYYGYDVKRDPAELIIASEVFSRAMRTESFDASMSNTMTEIMLVSEVTAITGVVKRGWSAVASRSAESLLARQLKVLANEAAQRRLQRAGMKGLESSLFKSIFAQQVEKKVAANTVKRAVPAISAVVAGCIDGAQMNQVITLANLFYGKRFLLEKEQRIADISKYDCITTDTDALMGSDTAIGLSKENGAEKENS